MKTIAEITDEYGAIHRVWKIAGAAQVQQLMADKKLLIADGHHRYETALAFRNENPKLPGADRVMMTFVNMHSPGVKILATHRLVDGIPTGGFPDEFLRTAADLVPPDHEVAAAHRRLTTRSHRGRYPLTGSPVRPRL